MFQEYIKKYNKIKELRKTLEELTSRRDATKDRKEFEELNSEIVKIQKSIERNKKELEVLYNETKDLRRESCWYRATCTTAIDCSSPSAYCPRYTAFKLLVDASDIPLVKQIPARNKLVPAMEDSKQFRRLNDIKNNIVPWVKEGNNLFICSTHTGNGKSTWAIKIMLKYFDQTWNDARNDKVGGMFVHVPTFLAKIKNYNAPLSEEYKENIIKADLVIWDDIAAAKLSSTDYNNLLQFIDGRILNNRSNIFTSNVTREEKFSEIMGSRLGSRIFASSEIIELYAKDWRSINDTDSGIK